MSEMHVSREEFEATVFYEHPHGTGHNDLVRHDADGDHYITDEGVHLVTRGA